MPRQIPKNGTSCVAGVANGADLALEGALAEAAGHQDAVHVAEHLFDVAVVEVFAIDQMHVGVAVVVHAGVVERLDDRQVRIGQADVLAHDGDVALAGRSARRRQGSCAAA